MSDTLQATTTGSEVFVSSAAELMAALETATGGETIVMAAANYGTLDLKASFHTFSTYAFEVTLRSADDADPAVFSQITLNGVSNLTFDGITLDYEAVPADNTWAKPFAIHNSDHVTVRNSQFDGDLAEGLGADHDGFGIGFGLSVTGSSYIEVADNEFSHWRVGAHVSNSEYLTVTGNDVHGISGDGLDFISVNNVLIEGNTLHDFARPESSTVHADMIQFWTTGDVTNTNVMIRGNVLDSGDGDWTQSIFMRNGAAEGASTTDMYYRNVVIEDNVIHNAHAHGISVGETIGLAIRNNTLLFDEDAGGTSKPSINVNVSAQDVVVTGNVTEGKLPVASGADWTVGNNLVVQRGEPQGSNYVGDAFVDALNNAGIDIAHLQALPGGLLEQMGVGSSLTRFDTEPSTSAGFVLNDAGADLQLLTHAFDASNIFGSGGRLDTAGATVVWDFGDGNVGTGLLASHTYTGAGHYDVKALVTLADGETVSLGKTVRVETPLTIDIDFNSGAEDLIANPDVAVGETVTFEGANGDLAARLNDNALTIKNKPGMTGNSEYTLVLDFKKDAGSELSGGSLVHFTSSFSISLGADSMSVMVGSDMGETRIGLNSIGIDNADWHRLALTFSGEAGEAVVYLDGAEIGRVSGFDGATQVGSPSHPLYLGSPWSGGFADQIDNFQFWRGAMSAAEIEALSTRAQDGKFAPLNDTATDPVEDTTTVPVEDTTTDPVEDTPTNPVEDTPTDPVEDTTTDPVEDTTADPVEDTTADPVEEDASLVFSKTDFDQLFIGGDGGETLKGSNGHDYIEGGGGSDVLRGQNGNDVLIGGDGNDQLSGGNGDDVMIGGMGSDSLHGDRGRDTFMFTDVAESLPGAGRDSIEDFTKGEDKIDVSHIDALAGGSNDAFVFIGTAAFTAAGQLRQFDFGNGIIVEGDVTGDGKADFQIALQTKVVLADEDFVL